MKFKIMLTLLLVFFLKQLVFGEKPDEEKFKPTISPYLKVQFWNAYSEGIQSADGARTQERLASYFRRGRAGLKGNLLPEISYNLMVSFDYLAKDENLSTKGTANAGTFSIWSFYFTWKLNSENDWLNITGGYFLPHLSRESTNSPWSVSSLDKAETSCYLRQFVTGKTNGISPGINIGGMGKIGTPTLLYNLSCVNRQDKTSIQTESWSPVVLGHFMLNFGDDEFQKYKYTFSNNVLKKQKSATLGVGFSKQGETDAFESSSTIGADATIYLGGLKMDGEYYRLSRKNESKYNAECAMGRVGYNIFLKKNWILEPVAMYQVFKGDDNYSDASFFDGSDKITDLGVNLISKPKNIKVNLHYIFHDGDGTKNHYISDEETPGNYAVLGIQFTI
ncbi:hypothetical protein GM418_15720 [Maribellus comscasis]|uniref:Porin n=1 Tax=Maribellus comscasis TaxID=2681766 RepID=A0A6I6JXX9_9BACT|nr:porin [Maribellus comscasis]QGY45067.1 hypothetical protein GM418_15720 [Maribellus comscasis]